MLVDIDDREPKEAMLLMKEVGMLANRKRMLVGDYVYNEVCCERKTIDDFCASIVDGRINKQVDAMKAKYRINFLMISKRIGDRLSDIHEHCILGKIASLAIRKQITILMFDNDYQLFYCMNKIFENYVDEMKIKHATKKMDKELAIDKALRKKGEKEEKLKYMEKGK